MAHPVDWALRMAAGVAAPGGHDGRLAILLYHRVLPQADPLNDWDVTASEFEHQMQVLRAHFSPLSLTEALDRLTKHSLPARAVCVTFDDGYADNAEVALPILRRCAIPATFFIATGFLNGGRMWNDSVATAVARWNEPVMDVGFGPLAVATAVEKRMAIARILRQWKYLPHSEREARGNALAHSASVPAAAALMMSDDQVCTLRDAGMGIGAHTVTHPILRHLNDREAAREIAESGSYLSQLLREPVPLFAYPNGKPGIDFGAREVAAVHAAGYQAAVSTAWGVARADTDCFQLPRFTPWERQPWRYSLRLIRGYRSAAPETVDLAATATPTPPQTFTQA